MENKNKFQYGNIIAISFAHTLHDIYSAFLAPILPLLIEKFKLSYTLAGLLTVVQNLPSLLNPFVGLIADKLPIRYLLIFAPSITVICMSFLGIAPYYSVLVILLFVMGIAASLFHVPAPVMIRKISGSRVGKGMSFFMFGGEIARSIGPLVILGGISLWGLEGTYKLIPFGLTASAILFFKFRNIKISDDLKNADKLKSPLHTFKEHLPLLFLIAGVSFFLSIIKAALTTFLPVYFTSSGSSLWTGGIALSILQLAGAIGTMLSGTISDKLGRKNTLLIIVVSNPLLMILFVYSTGILVYPLLALLGLFVFAITPIFLAIINETLSERPAFLNGLYMTVNFGTGALTVLIVGFLGDLIGLELTYKLSAVLGFAAIPFILKIKK